jgi:hypothetical protein
MPVTACSRFLIYMHTANLPVDKPPLVGPLNNPRTINGCGLEVTPDPLGSRRWPLGVSRGYVACD